MINKLSLLFNTLLNLEPIQIKYQIWYRFKKALGFKNREVPFKGESYPLNFDLHIFNASAVKDKTFRFLNLTKDFKNDIDWNFNEYGKLWTYNLNYFDFLLQENISCSEGVSLIQDFLSKYDTIKDGKESAPTAIRILNWIKFLAIHNIKDIEIEITLWKDAQRLLSNLEYHLLGNHLLEDAFGLLFSSYFFQDVKKYKIAKQILIEEMKEQVLPDGAHFELSPMYHQLILYRSLDAIQLLKENNWQEGELLNLLINKASKMVAWIKEISFSNGDLPLLNDSAKKIYPSTLKLLEYADRLDIPTCKIKLKESGYKKIKTKKYELIFDIGHIGPSYQPGHAHADTFNFLLHVNNKPILIDTGTSTYNVNNRRIYERSTQAHNTVTIEDKNSSQVWSGFRVGKMAGTYNVQETNNRIEACHDGYKNLGVTHSRKITNTEKEIEIIDKLEGKSMAGKAHFHFHYNVKITKINDTKYHLGSCQIEFFKPLKVSLKKIEYSEEFNLLISSNKLVVEFANSLVTKIYLT